MVKLVFCVNNYKWTKEELNLKLSQLPNEVITPILVYKNWKDRQAHILGKLLLHNLLNKFNSNLNLNELQINNYNKPYFKKGFNFSIAHSNELVTCIASNNCEVGIDIEFIDEGRMEYPLELFSDIECELFNKFKNYEHDFYKLFTRKEALAKVLGIGIFLDFKKITLIEDAVMLNYRNYYLTTFTVQNKYVVSYITTKKQILTASEFLTPNDL